MRLFVIVLGVISSPVAWSHGMHATHPGFASGLLHPMTGIDHVLAAVGMGLWLSQQNFTRWSIPLYSAALITGIAIACLVKGMVTDIEWILAFTLVVSGLFVGKSLRLPQPLAAAVITGVFSCHFYAHITEMPLDSSMPGYIAGFLTGTACMMALATAAGISGLRQVSPVWTRLAGVSIAMAGVAALGLA